MNGTVIFCLVAVLCTHVHVALTHEQYASILAEQLNTYCDSRDQGSIAVSTGAKTTRIGKAGPKGPRGPTGKPGSVNYTVVNELVETKLQELSVGKRLTNLNERITEIEKDLQRLKHVDCARVTSDFAKSHSELGGVFDIYIGLLGTKMEVFCDLTTDGGGWTVFQRRINGSADFYRNWDEYVSGFGNLAGEFWMGLEKLHRLTSRTSYELRIEFEDWEGNKPYAKYESFSVGDSGSKYTLTVADYSGTAGDSLQYHSGSKFSTFDQDNPSSCATVYKGAWWHKDCYYANLNGVYMNQGSYTADKAIGVEWWHYKNAHWYSMKFVEMKIRPKF
ncbi:microfibril-associated glycoprotein 4-like [Styela clava]|uniref:microfibril-associated glycoprotein 4-like n=1 Tax=Styela clava TaxID=7725 RepID=UPI00193A51DE|nr:microfibril-associated glycoprotein 4-like [Styela clava]